MKDKTFQPLQMPIDDLIDTENLISPLLEATKALGRYEEALNHSKLDLQYAMIHLINREAFFSTKIEGTQTTLTSVYEAEIQEDKENLSSDVDEVLRYQKALRYVEETLDSPVTIRMIKQIHKILLGNKGRGASVYAGEFRTLQNRVGAHLPPPPQEVDNCMANLERYINNEFESQVPTLIRAAIIHAQFETIHPFADGNGRTGRILIPLYLYQNKEIKKPQFFMSKALEKNKFEYYSYLQGTRDNTKEGYSDWIKFFLLAIKRQVDDDLEFIQKSNDVYDNLISRVKDLNLSANVIDIIKVMFDSPVFNVKVIEKGTSLKPPSIRRYLKILTDNKLIFSSGTRNKEYYCYEILNIL